MPFRLGGTWTVVGVGVDARADSAEDKLEEVAAQAKPGSGLADDKEVASEFDQRELSDRSDERREYVVTVDDK